MGRDEGPRGDMAALYGLLVFAEPSFVDVVLSLYPRTPFLVGCKAGLLGEGRVAGGFPGGCERGGPVWVESGCTSPVLVGTGANCRVEGDPLDMLRLVGLR